MSRALIASISHGEIKALPRIIILKPSHCIAWHCQYRCILEYWDIIYFRNFVFIETVYIKEIWNMNKAKNAQLNALCPSSDLFCEFWLSWQKQEVVTSLFCYLYASCLRFLSGAMVLQLPTESLSLCHYRHRFCAFFLLLHCCLFV